MSYRELPAELTRPDQMLTRREASELLDVSPATFASWREIPAFPPAVLVGYRVQYRAVDLLTWMAYLSDRTEERLAGRDPDAVEQPRYSEERRHPFAERVEIALADQQNLLAKLKRGDEVDELDKAELAEEWRLIEAKYRKLKLRHRVAKH